MKLLISKLEDPEITGPGIPFGDPWRDGRLWDFMAAWRGPDCKPDTDVHLIKFQTTHKIREWLKGFGQGLKMDLTKNIPMYTLRSINTVCGKHFGDHIAAAQRLIQRFEPEFRVYIEEKIPLGIPKDYDRTGK